jgi:hypothetical protein
VNYEDALDMYADDFDEKEKARMEQQAERNNKGEEAVSERERSTGNGIAEMPTSSSQEENQGNVFAVPVYCV